MKNLLILSLILSTNTWSKGSPNLQIQTTFSPYKSIWGTYDAGKSTIHMNGKKLQRESLFKALTFKKNHAYIVQEIPTKNGLEFKLNKFPFKKTGRKKYTISFSNKEMVNKLFAPVLAENQNISHDSATDLICVKKRRRFNCKMYLKIN